jgi:hypothetical protein
MPRPRLPDSLLLPASARAPNHQPLASSLGISVVALGLLGQPAAAQIVQVAAHDHGTVTVNVVQEGTQVLIELVSPKVNLLGFEHMPTTPEEQQAVAAVEAALLDAAQWVRVDGEQCTVKEGQLLASSADDDHEDQDHDHDHDTSADAGVEHEDYTVSFEYTCGEAELRGVTFTAFARYPGIATVALQWVLEAGAGALTLTPDVPSARF